MQRVAVVFGGGGMKGLSHVGAWRAIRESGLEVVRVLGSSIGALVGACVAAGESWSTLAPRALALSKPDIVGLNRWALLFNGIRQPSVFRGDSFQDYIRRTIPVDRFEELDLPLTINAVNLETGDIAWFGEGGRSDVPVADAVYASCALPLFYPPAEIDGEFYVDGGVRDALPVGRAAGGDDVDAIIAVDVAAGRAKDPADTVAKGLVALHHRVYDIMAYDRRRRRLETWQAPPKLVYVRPRLDGFSTFDFARTKYFLEEGYRAARAALSTHLAVTPDAGQTRAAAG